MDTPYNDKRREVTLGREMAGGCCRDASNRALSFGSGARLCRQGVLAMTPIEETAMIGNTGVGEQGKWWKERQGLTASNLEGGGD